MIITFPMVLLYLAISAAMSNVLPEPPGPVPVNPPAVESKE